jgi:hypothetical protein
LQHLKTTADQKLILIFMLTASIQRTAYLNLRIMWKFDEHQGFTGINRDYCLQVIKRITRGRECVVGGIMALSYAQNVDGLQATK